MNRIYEKVIYSIWINNICTLNNSFHDHFISIEYNIIKVTKQVTHGRLLNGIHINGWDAILKFSMINMILYITISTTMEEEMSSCKMSVMTSEEDWVPYPVYWVYTESKFWWGISIRYLPEWNRSGDSGTETKMIWKSHWKV